MTLPAKIAAAAAVAALPLFASAQHCQSTAAPERFVATEHNSLPSLFEIAFTTPTFSTLAGLVAVADLDEALGGGEFTVFAPTNDAFGKLGDETLRTLVDKDNRAALSGILTYHVVPGRIALDDIPQGTTKVETLAGELIEIKRDHSSVRVNGVRVVSPDVFASNGVAHVIEDVLSPDDAPQAMGLFDLVEDTSNLSTLEAAVEASGFARSLDNDGPYTVFAPTNAAFDALPSGTLDALLQHHNVEDLRAVLRLHIVAGTVDARGAVVAGEAPSREGSTLRFEIDNGQLFVVRPVNRAKVIATNITADNGIAHVIDTVCFPVTPTDVLSCVAGERPNADFVHRFATAGPAGGGTRCRGCHRDLHRPLRRPDLVGGQTLLPQHSRCRRCGAGCLHRTLAQGR